MTQLLLAVLYLSFISVGLPDSLLGAAWPGQRALNAKIANDIKQQ